MSILIPPKKNLPKVVLNDKDDLFLYCITKYKSMTGYYPSAIKQKVMLYHLYKEWGINILKNKFTNFSHRLFAANFTRKESSFIISENDINILYDFTSIKKITSSELLKDIDESNKDTVITFINSKIEEISEINDFSLIEMFASTVSINTRIEDNFIFEKTIGGQ